VAKPHAALAVADRLLRHDGRADAADERERREGGGRDGDGDEDEELDVSITSLTPPSSTSIVLVSQA
jgi:hypothetical protein